MLFSVTPGLLCMLLERWLHSVAWDDKENTTAFTTACVGWLRQNVKTCYSELTKLGGMYASVCVCVSLYTCVRDANCKSNLRLLLNHAAPLHQPATYFFCYFFLNAITPKSCHQMPWLGIRTDRGLTHYAGSLTSSLFLCDFATHGRKPVTFGGDMRITRPGPPSWTCCWQRDIPRTWRDFTDYHSLSFSGQAIYMPP